MREIERGGGRSVGLQEKNYVSPLDGVGFFSSL